MVNTKQKEKANVAQSDVKINEIMQNAPKDENVDINAMPLESLEDYKKYNERARMLNKKLGIRRYPIKPCPVELHPKQWVVLSRNDQPNNDLPVYLSNDEIEFKEIIKPGKKYHLPLCVIDYLASKGSPYWKWFTKADGSKETGIDHYSPRFSIRTVFEKD